VEGKPGGVVGRVLLWTVGRAVQQPIQRQVGERSGGLSSRLAVAKFGHFGGDWDDIQNHCVWRSAVWEEIAGMRLESSESLR